MNFSQTLLKLMNDNKISAYKMWQDTGIQQSVIGRWCSGNTEPAFTGLLKVADYFGVSVDYLIGREFDELKQEKALENLKLENSSLRKENAFLKERLEIINNISKCEPN